MAKKQTATQESAGGAVVLLQLDPAHILSDDNVRFGLRESRIQSLAASISQHGVMEPIEVEPLLPDESKNGFAYRVTDGAYRHAAVSHLNKSQSDKVYTVPAILKRTSTSQERLARQVDANKERENMTLMDMAVAIDKLFKAGYTRAQVREKFPRNVSKTGDKQQMASNAYINIVHGFLRFPKKTQTMLHTGILGFTAGYEISRRDPSQWDSIVEKAVEERVKEIERDDKDEERFTKAEAAAEEANKLMEESKTELDKAISKEAETEKALLTITAKAEEAYKATLAKGDPKARKEAVKAHKAIEVDRADAVVAHEKAAKDRQGIEKKQADKVSFAAEKAAKLKELREGRKADISKDKGRGKGTSLSGQDIKKAAKEVGADSKPVPMQYRDLKDAIHEWTLPGAQEDLRKVFAIVERCISGELTPNQGYDEMLKLV